MPESETISFNAVFVDVTNYGYTSDFTGISHHPNKTVDINYES